MCYLPPFSFWTLKHEKNATTETWKNGKMDVETEKWTLKHGKNATKPFHFAFKLFYIENENFYWWN